MGTSSSYGGPKGNFPLLPPWAQGDPGPVDEPANAPADDGLPTLLAVVPRVPTGNLGGAKRLMTRFAHGGGRETLRRAGRAYVEGRGGARASAGSATSGRTATARLAGFFADVANRGADVATRALGLVGLAGQRAEVAIARIVNAIAPNGAGLEDAAARAAVTATLEAVFDRLVGDAGDLAALDAVDANFVRDAVSESVVVYIYSRWLEELVDRIEENAVSESEAVRLEREVKDYVREAVRIDLRDIDVLAIDWSGPVGQGLVDRVYQEAYGFLENG